MDFEIRHRRWPVGSVCGWGNNDVDFCTSYRGQDGKMRHHPAYKDWSNMVNRVYGGRNLSYADCTISDQWKNFSSFLSWWEDNYIEDYQLDKYILKPGNREYGPETCLYVPAWINNWEAKSRPNKSRNGRLQGVTFDRNLGKYKAQRDSGEDRYLGYFDTEEEAHEAWVADGGWTKREAIRKEYDIWRENKIQISKPNSN